MMTFEIRDGIIHCKNGCTWDYTWAEVHNKYELMRYVAKQQGRIIQGFGYPTCGFCQKYFEAHCVGCPIFDYTGQSSCRGTPFDALDNERDFTHWLELLDKLIAFLHKVEDGGRE
jgi:hypothetical protein